MAVGRCEVLPGCQTGRDCGRTDLVFFNVCPEENAELEKARQEWEALENVQPGQTPLAASPDNFLGVWLFFSLWM